MDENQHEGRGAMNILFCFFPFICHQYVYPVTRENQVNKSDVPYGSLLIFCCCLLNVLRNITKYYPYIKQIHNRAVSVNFMVWIISNFHLHIRGYKFSLVYSRLCFMSRNAGLPLFLNKTEAQIDLYWSYGVISFDSRVWFIQSCPPLYNFWHGLALDRWPMTVKLLIILCILYTPWSFDPNVISLCWFILSTDFSKGDKF